MSEDPKDTIRPSSARGGEGLDASTRRVLLLNPPSRHRVQRRYCGTFLAQDFLYPPLELAQLAAISRQWHGWETRLLDSIALDLPAGDVLNRIRKWQPDVIVQAQGFSTFLTDCQFLDTMKQVAPGCRVGVIGYLPSRHAEEFMQKTRADFILADEPERGFSALLRALDDGRQLVGIPGLHLRQDGAVCLATPAAEDSDLDQLPFPEPLELPLHPYGEPLQPKPLWAILTSRGCPYSCNFCVTTYGKTARYRSPRSVAAEVEHLVGRYGVRSIRFLDDTFTLNRSRVLEICDRLQSLRQIPGWTALSRLDTLDDELLQSMAAAGCRRLDLGIESGSQSVLDSYRKGIVAADVPDQVGRIRAAGIETLGFFIVGAPGETGEDIQASVDLAIKANLDYVVVTRLQSWPGTPLPSTQGVAPAGNPFAGPPVVASSAWAERLFYRKFYFRTGYILPRLRRLLSHPWQSVSAGVRLHSYAVASTESDHI